MPEASVLTAARGRVSSGAEGRRPSLEKGVFSSRSITVTEKLEDARELIRESLLDAAELSALGYTLLTHTCLEALQLAHDEDR